MSVTLIYTYTHTLIIHTHSLSHTKIMSLSELVRCNILLLRKGINTTTTRNHLRLLVIGRRAYSTPHRDTSLKTKVWNSVEEAIRDVRSGHIVLVGGFGLAGVPGMCVL